VTVAVVPPVVVAVFPPGVTVTAYPVTKDPPSLAGAVQDTPTWALASVAKTPVGAPGTVAGACGVTAALAADAGEVPTGLVGPSGRSDSGQPGRHLMLAPYRDRHPHGKNRQKRSGRYDPLGSGGMTHANSRSDLVRFEPDVVILSGTSPDPGIRGAKRDRHHDAARGRTSKSWFHVGEGVGATRDVPQG
jgi:hypothetical protein